MKAIISTLPPPPDQQNNHGPAVNQGPNRPNSPNPSRLIKHAFFLNFIIIATKLILFCLSAGAKNAGNVHPPVNNNAGNYPPNRPNPGYPSSGPTGHVQQPARPTVIVQQPSQPTVIVRPVHPVVEVFS